MVSSLKKENIALFNNVKVIIHLICVECVKVALESVEKSLVSQNNKDFGSSWQSTKQDSMEKMIIPENGSLLHNADEILERALSQFWRVGNNYGKWNFLCLFAWIYVHKQEPTVRLPESC